MYSLKAKSSRVCLSAVVLFIFTLVLGGGAFAAEKVNLEYKYKMGDKFKYDITMNGSTIMETAGNKGQAPVDVKMQVEQNVLFVNSKSGNIDIQTKILAGKAKNAEGVFEDLKNVGNTVYMTITNRGELLGATSYDLNYDPISVSISFPKEPVEIGKKWSTEVKQPIPMKIEYHLKELKSLKGRKCAVIEQKIGVGPEIKNITAKGTGTIYFDIEKGNIVMVETQNDMKMDQQIENDSPNLGPAVKDVKTTITLKTKMELVK
ncbi:MAG TPA: hypothetical protein DC017_07275 [Candidatus Wallbacteria bacterium]|nr:hypothetical protein [Candidatus Wallbacteria bacterium]